MSLESLFSALLETQDDSTERDEEQFAAALAIADEKFEFLRWNSFKNWDLFFLTTDSKKRQKRTLKFNSMGLSPRDGKMIRKNIRQDFSGSACGELFFTGSDSRAFLFSSILTKSLTGGTGLSGESSHFLLAKLRP
jgi:hypothetical protein